MRGSKKTNGKKKAPAKKVAKKMPAGLKKAMMKKRRSNVGNARTKGVWVSSDDDETQAAMAQALLMQHSARPAVALPLAQPSFRPWKRSRRSSAAFLPIRLRVSRCRPPWTSPTQRPDAQALA